jgi:hypothetical protein
MGSFTASLIILILDANASHIVIFISCQLMSSCVYLIIGVVLLGIVCKSKIQGMFSCPSLDMLVIRRGMITIFCVSKASFIHGSSKSKMKSDVENSCEINPTFRDLSRTIG